MNRSAYFTTGFAIKALANLSKADVVIHGEENIPKGPSIFVINHFTRIETLLIPYYIYNLTSIPAFSLAADELFKGALKRLLDMIGVISTKDPNRDRIIIKGLLNGKENWIIFPEGRMVKTKKIMGKGKFLIRHEHGSHKPHTGAASLALRAEFIRRHLLARETEEPLNVQSFLRTFNIDSVDDIRGKWVSIVPVNLTYYPIRAKENIASYFAGRLMKEVPDRMLEELMIEGTMLLSGVDLDIRFGLPITMDGFLSSAPVQKELQRPIGREPGFSAPLTVLMRRQANDIMQRYMGAIYDMTTINHEHLFASFLAKYPCPSMSEIVLRRKVFLAARKICEKNSIGCSIHKSLLENQVHLLTDDRFKKVENFLELALQKNILKKEKDKLIKLERKIPDLLLFHRTRIDNPIDVMANEVEPLQKLQRLIRFIAWQPSFLIRATVVNTLLREELRAYREDCRNCSEKEMQSDGPFLLHGSTRKIGVVLVHSYLSVPEEVMELAHYLNSRGFWVYAPRLAGHGTSPEDLAGKSYADWQLSVEKGYAVMSSICKNVILGGMSFGGSLVLELAARLPKLGGVFAICPPFRLKDYSTSFMPGIDVRQRILAKITRSDFEVEFCRFRSENHSINYSRNPIMGIKNVGILLEKLRLVTKNIHHACLILHSDRDPLVDSAGSKKIYDDLRAAKKEYVLLNYEKHIIIQGEECRRVHHLIENFIRDIK